MRNNKQNLVMNRRTQRKWEKNFPTDKKVAPSIKGTLFRTHDIGLSQSEILLPQKYESLNKLNRILIITSGKETIYAQISNSAVVQEHLNEVSILKNLVDRSGIQRENNGTFTGEMSILQDQQGVPHNAHVELVEILVKETYFSRRDQYKVMKVLREGKTHVFVKKVLLFDEIQLQVTNLMRNNSEIMKSGIIDKQTKVIFRSACAKSTIMIEIAQETFKFNANRQLYLEKMLSFLIIYFMRNNFFNNKHRVEIIFFGRLFYPQFEKLSDAYAYLVKDITSLGPFDKFEVNFAVALQKDHKGRIYQDVYRRIIWPGNSIRHFADFFWEKISQFMFTINWQYEPSQLGTFLAEGMENMKKKSTGVNIDPNKQSSQKPQEELKKHSKIKPFVQRLKCKLSPSKDSNLFQAVSLMGEQYSHHYYFRSLVETGNSIVVLSAGTSMYEVDETTYRMAKSYIYLTNISCVHVNLNCLVNRLKVQVNKVKDKPRYRNYQDVEKLRNLICWCMEERIYLSPMNQRMIFREDFQLKSAIYPEELQLQEADQGIYAHQCSKDRNSHYYLKEQQKFRDPQLHSYYNKQIQWIDTCHFDDQAFRTHEIFYEKANFAFNMYPSPKRKDRQDVLSQFQDDIKKIITQKGDWYGIGPQKNNLQRLTSKLNKENQQEIILKLYQTQVMLQSEYECHDFDDSISDQPDLSPNETTSKFRKGSETIWSQQTSEANYHNINIFEATFLHRQYLAVHFEQQRKRKKPSHNKFRLNNNFNDSNIHYLLPHFSEGILKQFKTFIRREYLQPLTAQQRNMIHAFELEKEWKKICFPILTPIYTKCNETLANEQSNLGPNKVADDNSFEQEICSRLMQNYQIVETDTSNHTGQYQVKLSKGHISYVLNRIDQNLSVYFATDKNRQSQTVPFMLYRYLSYQERDCRFCSKFINFANKNFYHKNYNKYSETKSVKMVFIYNEEGTRQSTKRNFYKDFISSLAEKYKEIKMQVTEGEPGIPPPTASFQIIIEKHSFTIYKNEQIKCTIDKTYNFKNLFSVVIHWNTCASALVNEFVHGVETVGRRNRLNSYLMTTEDPFNIRWSIQTIGQIVFQNGIGIEFMRRSQVLRFEWLWGNKNYYMNSSGSAFIKFKIDKKLILWKDNIEVLRNQKEDKNKEEYNSFFMLSAAFDFFGTIIDDVFIEVQRLRKEREGKSMQMALNQ